MNKSQRNMVFSILTVVLLMTACAPARTAEPPTPTPVIQPSPMPNGEKLNTKICPFDPNVEYTAYAKGAKSVKISCEETYVKFNIDGKIITARAGAEHYKPTTQPVKLFYTFDVVASDGVTPIMAGAVFDRYHESTITGACRNQIIQLVAQRMHHM